MRSRAAAIRSLVASCSIFAAHAMTAMITSACGPFRSKPSATLTRSTPCARSSSSVESVSAIPVLVSRSRLEIPRSELHPATS
jgi:hypothetical protein